MTTVLDAVEAVYQRWLDGWTATASFTLANEDFTPPHDQPWARLTVRDTASGGQTLGGAPVRQFRRLGSIFVNLFVPADEGEKRLAVLAQTALDLFESADFGGLRTLPGEVRQIGSDGTWSMAVVEVPFDYHQRK